jgi:hypothetical protein
MSRNTIVVIQLINKLTKFNTSLVTMTFHSPTINKMSTSLGPETMVGMVNYIRRAMRKYTTYGYPYLGSCATRLALPSHCQYYSPSMVANKLSKDPETIYFEMSYFKQTRIQNEFSCKTVIHHFRWLHFGNTAPA